MGYVIRVANSNSPISRYPQLKGGPGCAACHPQTEEQYNTLLAQFHAAGTTVYDSGPEDNYHMAQYVFGLVPNGYHDEPPTVPPVNIDWSNPPVGVFYAIVPDGKTRVDIGG